MTRFRGTLTHLSENSFFQSCREAQKNNKTIDQLNHLKLKTSCPRCEVSKRAGRILQR
ncbi:hypothetical protein MtrunA17_Chr8g0341681 [Medicago truncatula]|uniref:Uncharacterized protein n=1 Tax=Medicago truncatula TaxID=3880 RepID=A0A396GCL8_MEDTR|nr:hypothetical protein MtrunA17_Chr8g0341681 [Medicago truncatula]